MKRISLILLMISSFVMFGCSDVQFESTVPLTKLDDNTDGVLSGSEIQDENGPEEEIIPPVISTPVVTTPGPGKSDDKKPPIVVAPGEEEGGNLDEDIPGNVDENYSCGPKTDKKVMICHVPPGNPDARHTICIGKGALQAHLDHIAHDDSDQDHLGACK